MLRELWNSQGQKRKREVSSSSFPPNLYFMKRVSFLVRSKV
jgi:hypothetical protein